MIFDNIKNAQNYSNLSESIKAGLKFLSENNLSTLPVGTVDIVKDRVWAIIQEYATKQEVVFEAHRDCIDIQYIVKGKERLGFANLENCSGSFGYDSEKDIEFFNSFNNGNFIVADENDFIIFFPQDAHAPALAVDTPELVKKIVIKIRI